MYTNAMWVQALVMVANAMATRILEYVDSTVCFIVHGRLKTQSAMNEEETW